MLQNNKGYLAITELYAFTIYIFLLLFILPSLLTIHQEQIRFEEKRMVMHLLHSELQKVIWDATLDFPTSYSMNYKQTPMHFTFEEETNVIRGCVEWTSKREKQSKECFYAKAYK
ncbi:hypothetical protein [Pontibacillus yanchengensis]|uniref:Competence protein ComG n=1 Tax=Pontibacillus yanchengensis Y32 TaxID=1385514 RepID=A0A0A2TEX9_9BACI|nr:hypothetical protein [Pontibacillus yanchengensis]KGP72983.1 hypothetical protein N782_08570 [Pontibacillus yanchengensis Y32]